MADVTTTKTGANWPKRVLSGLVTVLAVMILVPLLLIFGIPLAYDLLGQACTEDDRAVWASIDHYVANDPWENAGTGTCAGGFTTSAPARDVLDHYEAALTADGWAIVRRSDMDPSVGVPTPGPDGEAVEIQGGVSSLVARRDGYELWVEYSTGWANAGPSDGPPQWQPSTSVSLALGHAGSD